MTITIEAKPLEIKAELPGYGIFYVRHLGAAKQAALMDKLDQGKALMDEVSVKYKDLLEREQKLIADNNDGELAALRSSDEYKMARKEQCKATEVLDQAVEEQNKAMISLWRSEDPEALERFLNDFSIKQIRGFYAQVMASEADNA